MPRSFRSSSASVSCRLEWRPSRWLTGALLLAGVLASFSLQVSAMPGPMAWLFTICVLAYAAWLAWREWRQPPRLLAFRGDALPVLVDGLPVERVEVKWRGPLAFMSWRGKDGRRGHLSWWPDTLPPAHRRELRLAVGNAEASRHGPAMSP